MKGAARARTPGNKRRGRVAPAELARLLSLPDDHPDSLLKHGFTEKQIDDESSRLRGLHARLYGRVVFPLRGPGEVHAPPAGGHAGGQCCSHAWADEVWRRLDVVYPPRPDRGNPPACPPDQLSFRLAGTRPDPIARAMVCCPGCAAFVPASYLDSGGVCWDCHHEADEGRSIGTQRSGSLIGPRELRER